MRINRAVEGQLAELRNELLAWNRIEQLRARDEDPSFALKSLLKHPSREALLEQINTVVGPDDRINYPMASSEIKTVIDSVALICHSDGLIAPTPQDPNWTLSVKQNCICPGQNNFPGEVCTKARKATGFLVGVSGMYLLTANHAVVDTFGNLIQNLFCVFGYRMTGPSTSSVVTSFSSANVVALKNLVTYGRTDDWALVELATPTSRPGLALRASGDPSVADRVIAIGYPNGLPVKSGPGTIRDITTPEYLADLDLSPGNSGGPVMAVDGSGNPTFVEGIVAMAHRDLVASPNCSTWMPACGQSSCFPGFVPIAKVLADPIYRVTV